MLAHDWVVFAERHLFGDVARVFLGHIEKAGVSGADELDLDRGWLRHGPFLLFKNFAKNCADKITARFTDAGQCGFASIKSSLKLEDVGQLPEFRSPATKTSFGGHLRIYGSIPFRTHYPRRSPADSRLRTHISHFINHVRA